MKKKNVLKTGALIATAAVSTTLGVNAKADNVTTTNETNNISSTTSTPTTLEQAQTDVNNK
ncbi:hypothetical protein, partial [Ligilactobacillus salivarius]